MTEYNHDRVYPWLLQNALDAGFSCLDQVLLADVDTYTLSLMAYAYHLYTPDDRQTQVIMEELDVRKNIGMLNMTMIIMHRMDGDRGHVLNSYKGCKLNATHIFNRLHYLWILLLLLIFIVWFFLKPVTRLNLILINI